jgi:phosphoribulokinase
MSVQHPIVAVTGSSGAGTSTVRRAFADIFRRQGINAQYVQGAGFHRYTAADMKLAIAESTAAGRPFTRFGPESNLFAELEALFRDYGKSGGGRLRYYIHDADDAARHGGTPEAFTEWRDIPPGSDLLFYEGMHGGVVADTWGRRRKSPTDWPEHMERRDGKQGVDVARHVDLLIGVVPGVNLEWIQKIHRDCSRGNCSSEEVVETILRRMPDYVNFIVPQFTVTDINFQRMPLVDTSHPFIARDVPSPDESFVVIHFRDPKKFDFPYLLKRIDGARMSRRNTMLAPGGKMLLALETICGPLVEEMMEQKRLRPNG